MHLVLASYEIVPAIPKCSRINLDRCHKAAIVALQESADEADEKTQSSAL